MAAYYMLTYTQVEHTREKQAGRVQLRIADHAKDHADGLAAQFRADAGVADVELTAHDESGDVIAE